MRRLSLKPGGTKGMWEVWLDTHGSTFYQYNVPDEDLTAIQFTLAEYFAAKAVAEKPKRNWWNVVIGPLWWALLGSAACVGGFIIGWNRVPTIPVSTGGVIDQLCMRPDIECSTSIRYVHPQKSGIVEQGDPVPQMECIAVDPQGNYHPEPCSKSEEQ